MFPRDPVSNVLSASIRNPEEQDDSCMVGWSVSSTQAGDQRYGQCASAVLPYSLLRVKRELQVVLVEAYVRGDRER